MGQTLIVHSPLSLAHETGPRYIEAKSRYAAIINALRQTGLVGQRVRKGSSLLGFERL